MGIKDLPDCTDRCRSVQHGDIITAAISRKCVSDYDLCCYLNHICTCCESVRDSVGRTALHVAASCGRIHLIQWLFLNRHANLNAKDTESGFTPLHRAIFYGQLNAAVELVKLGADTTLLDADSLTMLEHAMIDGHIPESSDSGEVYAWGTNCNNSLGPHQSKSVPELLDAFHKTYADSHVKKVCLEKFHSLILTTAGRVAACGHGQGGRLALGHQQTVVAPELVHFPEYNSSNDVQICVDIACGRDHSLFLMADCNIYTCGLNTHKVLGLKSAPAQVLVPTYVKRIDGAKGVCAGQYHSVVWGPSFIYTWGLNAGQLGHKLRTDDKYITTPKTVPLDVGSGAHILAVDSSDGAVVIYTSKGDIYALHEYQIRKVASRQLNIVQVGVFGGSLNLDLKDKPKDLKHELKIVALTNTGNLLLWQESDPQLYRCIFSLNRPIVVKQVAINANGLLFVTRDGEAFRGLIRARNKKKTTAVTNVEKSAFHKFLERDDCISVKLTKFPRIHRAINIESDGKGNDYCVIQAPPYKRFTAPEIGQSKMEANLSGLLHEADINDDLHDVVFSVEGKLFAAHRFIVASKCAHFEKVFVDEMEETGNAIELQGCNAVIFQQFLQYIYTGDCELLRGGDEAARKLSELLPIEREQGNDLMNNNEEAVNGKLSAFQVYNNGRKSKKQSENNNNNNKGRNPIRLLQEMAKRFACRDLSKVLALYEKKKSNGFAKTAVRLDRLNPSEFYDVTIQCFDGKLVKAHKCVLAAQCDYFNSLFSIRWNGTETSTITLPTNRTIVEDLLEYLYTDNLLCHANKDQDQLFKLIVLADQLFIERLKEKCEFYLFQRLTLKNCVQYLAFADVYNAKKLKNCCLKFIIANITPLLELRLFDELDEGLIKELSAFYYEQKAELQCRMITPYSTAPLEEEILSVSASFPVSLDEQVQKQPISTKSKRERRVRQHKTSEEQVTPQKMENKVESNENIIQFPDSPIGEVLMEQVVPNRLRAIRLAQNRIDDEEDVGPQFTKLISKQNLFNSSVEEFPELSSPPANVALSFTSKSPHNKFEKHKMVKISQKQRKRMSSESETPSEVVQSPKNPWKTVPEMASFSPKESSISSIINLEKKQKENLVKITSKLLIYTQMEDKAIEDLKKFYNTNNENDEFITICRVELGAVAAPIWVPGVKKMESM